MTEPNENSFETREGYLPVYFACIWMGKETGKKQSEGFQERIPRYMEWLDDLKQSGNLVACGSGSYGRGVDTDYSGGLTIIKAKSYEEAVRLSEASPMNEIGTSTVLLWDVFHANITENVEWGTP